MEENAKIILQHQKSHFKDFNCHHEANKFLLTTLFRNNYGGAFLETRHVEKRNHKSNLRTSESSLKISRSGASVALEKKLQKTNHQIENLRVATPNTVYDIRSMLSMKI